MKNLKKAVALLLVACLALSLACCGKSGNNDPSEGSTDGMQTYTVKVTAVGGAPIEGVGVYVYEDPGKSELTWFDKTDANGEISFTAPVKDRYYAVLSDVPAGYIVEDMYSINGLESLFVLDAAPIDEVDPEEVRYELGDTIGDFTVVATDGTEYTLSQLLQQKKTVVLNFWYIECNPCRAEFPFMNEAYAEFAGDIALIAMNPVNTSEEDIAAFKSELGLDFPVAMADAAWADMLSLTAYPTTVVIDRFGVISLMHVGSIDTADTFKQIFQYFASEDYVPGVVESLEDLPPYQEDETVGTAEHPYEQGATGTKITLKPGQEFHVDFLKASGMYMNVTGSDFYVIYNGQKTNSSAGYVGMMVESEGTFYPVKVIFGNPTDKEQEISITFGALKGSVGNPYKLSLGEFDMKTGAGNEEGVFGLYTAEKDGRLIVRCLSSSVSKYGFFLYNLRSYAMRNTNEDGAYDEDGYLYTAVKVKAGDQISFSVAVDRDENNVIAAGSFRFELILEEGDGEEDKKAEPPKTAYAVTVVDQDNNAVADVGVNLKGEFTYEPTENDPEGLEPTQVKVDLNLTTDAEGHIISEQITGPYVATIRVPEGYRLEQTQYELNGDTYTVTVQLQKIVMVDYVITVVDEAGNPVAGVSLMMGANFGTTNEEGIYTVNLEEAEYTVLVFAGIPEGYLPPADSYLIPAGESQLTIQLEKEGEPEPEYTDIFGEFPIVTDQLAPGQKAYYNVYNAGGASLVIEDADAFVIIGEETYEAVDGVVSVPVPVTMGRMPVQIVIGNGGAETESYTANVVFPAGSQQNPESLVLGDITTELAEGNSTGYNYTWTAEEDGVLTLVYTGETGVAGETFEVMLTNNTSYECPLMSESEDGKTVSIAVKAGDLVSILVNALPNENWEYPATTVTLKASFGEAHVHEYTAVVTEPTCTEGGYTTYTCACGDSYVGDEVEAIGHKYEAVVTAPTCTEGGYTTFTCTVCDYSYVGDEVAATGHKYEAVVTAPTCTEGGYTTYTCTCGDTYVGDEVAATGHKYEAVVTAPTCTEGGYTTYTCTCGDSYVGDEVAATGHKYEAVVTAPTCTEGGYTTYTCTCGDSYTGDEVAALGHDYVSEVIEPTTTAQGYTLHTCSRCGDSYKDNYTDKLPADPDLPPHEHAYTAVVTAPTCTEDGYTTYTCECGDSYTADEVKASGHVYETVVTEPTCTEGGCTTYTCAVCDYSYVDNQVDAVGHKYDTVVTAPTCTEGGYTTFTCTVCSYSYVGDEVAATGHKHEAVVTAPTCTEDGYTTYTCACGDSYVGDEVAATGHKHEAVVTAPTCTEKGYTTYTCACGDSYVGDEVAATGHKHEAVVTAPTCTEGGYTTYTCACGDSYVGDEVAATGHKHEAVVTAPTCAEGGYTTYTCACGDSYVGDEVVALGHDYVSEVIAPTTAAQGYTLHTCSRCGDSYKDNYTDKLPEESDTVNYVVTVTDFDGNALNGVAVQILKGNGAPAKVGVTGANGKLTASLEPGDYTVKLAFTTTGNHYEEKTAVLSADAPELTIRVTSTMPTVGAEDHWMLGKADLVGLGGTYVSIQKDVMTYFLFTPEEAGTYRFTTSDPEAIISYWGGENFPSNQTANTDYKDNVFTLSVSQSYLGQSYVIGVTGTDDCILIIERQGEAAFNPNELPYTKYELAEEPKPFTLVKDGTLTFVDLSAKTEDYTLVLGNDGYYHLGTADGPVMYVCLGGNAPYLSLFAMCGGGGITGAPFRYTDYSDLDNIVKEDYTECILAYGACMDKATGVYPMTEDLFYILQMGVEHMQWADPDSPNFLFAEVENYNPELGWMFAICYLVK